MKRKSNILKQTLFVLTILQLVNCRTPYTVSSVQPSQNISIDKSFSEDVEFNTLISPYKLELESKMNTPISYTTVDLTKEGDNSSLGNLLADFTFQGANDWSIKTNSRTVDAAVINIGGIRSTIGKGEILIKHVYEVMPFENEIVLVKLTGKQLLELYKYYIQTQKNNPVYGLYIETNKGEPVKFNINGEEVLPSKSYLIATSDYLATGGDKMTFFLPGEVIPTGIKMRNLFMEKFKSTDKIIPPTDIRLNFRNKTNTQK